MDTKNFLYFQLKKFIPYFGFTKNSKTKYQHHYLPCFSDILLRNYKKIAFRLSELVASLIILYL